MTILLAGLAMGAVYALIAACYNAIQTTSGVLNFATAHVMTVGSFVAAITMTGRDVPLPIVLLACAAAGAVVGGVVELAAIAPLSIGWIRRHHTADSHTELVTTLGAATIITGLAYLIWGPDPRRVPLFVDDARVGLLGGQVRRSDLVLIAVAVAVCLSLHWWSRRSRFGLASLAQTEDRDSAILQGINVRLLSFGGFVVVGALGGVLGVVVGAKTYATVSIAMLLAVKGFVVMVLGGVGNQIGALLAGAVIGVAEISAARWLGPDYRLIAVFVIFLAVLVIRPRGLLGSAELRGV